MVDIINVGEKASSAEVSPKFEPYSKVVIHVSDETTYEVGDDTGRVLEFDNPFGTQPMAQDILNKLVGFQYQPYDAKGVILDPSAEMGDAVSAYKFYGGIYKRARDFGRLMKADTSAPHSEEINHEFKFESPTVRQFKRETAEVKASLQIANDRIVAEVSRASAAEGELSSMITQTAGAISACVTKQGGSNVSGSFSWKMDSDGHYWYANGNSTPVMEITASGLVVNGIINAKRGGTIGGFNIGSNSLYNGVTSLNDTSHSGVYVGTDGIRVGPNFQVSSSGQVNAASMALTGTLTIGSSTIGADTLRLGALWGYNGANRWNDTTGTVNNYSGDWNSAASSTRSGGYCYDGATEGYDYKKAKSGTVTVNTFYINNLYLNNLRFAGSIVQWRQVNGIWCMARY